MARRRPSRSVPFVPLLVLLAIAIAGALAWRHREAWLPTPPPSGTASTAPVPAAFDVCAMAARERIASALRVPSVEARHVGAASGVPAAGSCTFDFATPRRGGSVVALAFTRESLARGGSPLAPHEYYASVVTGLEYELKSVPRPIAGLGDEAASAGFDGAAGAGQLVARRGDLVLHLVSSGADAAATEALARALLAAR